MKSNRIVIFLILILQPVILSAQEIRIVSGTLKDVTTGDPLPGVNIVIEGTTTGVLTDVDGKYSINASLGSVLVFSFIGYNPQKVLVTEKNSKPLGSTSNLTPVVPLSNQPVSNKKKTEVKYQSSFTPVQINDQYLPDTIRNSEGTATFSAVNPSYKIVNPYGYHNRIEPARISNIQFDKDRVKIIHRKDKYITIPHIEVSSSISVDKSKSLPLLQNIYAQGRPSGGNLQWYGPETGESFSWGPSIKNLEYDGLTYNYDKNGHLVPYGSGNGKPANTYNPLDFFQTGITLSNSIQLQKQKENNAYSFLYSNNNIKGVIPNSGKNTHIVAFIYEGKINRYLRFKNNFNFESNVAKYISSSPVTSLLLSTVYLTPPTFDNANGFSSGEAVTNQSAYLLDNNLQRSCSENNSNNPYWLINNVNDRNKQTSWNESLEVKLRIIENLNFRISGSIGKQQFNYRYGYPIGTNGLNKIQNEDESRNVLSLSTLSNLYYYLNHNDFTLNASLNYDFRYTKAELRQTYSDISDNLSLKNQFTPWFRSHNIGSVTEAKFQDILIARFTQNLISNTYPVSTQKLYSPAISMALNVHELFYDTYPLEQLKIRGSWGYVYSEIPLLLTPNYYTYQPLEISDYRQSFFNYGLMPDFTLKPEKIVKKGIGADISLFSNKLSLVFDYFENITYRQIYPVWEPDGFKQKNCTDYRVRGIEIELMYNNYSWRKSRQEFKLSFTSIRNKILRLYDNTRNLPLSGFSNIYTSLIEGLPKGVIVGTSYQRNQEGQLIIGDDGYPLVSDDLKVLADPNPDFTIGFEAKWFLHPFSFGCIMNLSIGGLLWNGTENVMSYYGVSQKSADERTITNYIYQGVRNDGSRNSIPVDFANPVLPLSSNRWLHYGTGGVAEDAIYNASYFRISQLTIGYSIPLKNNYNIELTTFITNPVLITSASGVDPSSLLWDDNNAKGLQIFNMPSVTSMGLSIHIKL